MPWTSIDDGASYHPKARKAGLEAWGFYVASIVYSNKLLKDGFIAEDCLEDVWPWGGKLKQLAERLVMAKLFDPCEGGWRIHDYLQHQRSREDILAQRTAEAERKKAARAQLSGRRPAGVRPDAERTTAGLQPPSAQHPVGVREESERSPALACASARALPPHPFLPDREPIPNPSPVAPVLVDESLRFPEPDARPFNERDLEIAVSDVRGTDWRLPTAPHHRRQARETAALIMVFAYEHDCDPHAVARAAYDGWRKASKSIDPMVWCSDWAAKLPPPPKPKEVWRDLEG